jgi:hypothetical protein
MTLLLLISPAQATLTYAYFLAWVTRLLNICDWSKLGRFMNLRIYRAVSLHGRLFDRWNPCMQHWQKIHRQICSPLQVYFYSSSAFVTECIVIHSIHNELKGLLRSGSASSIAGTRWLVSDAFTRSEKQFWVKAKFLESAFDENSQCRPVSSSVLVP